MSANFGKIIKIDFIPIQYTLNAHIKGKVRVPPCTGTEALYRPYGP